MMDDVKMTVESYLKVCWTAEEIFDNEIKIYDNETKELIVQDKAVFLSDEIENAELVDVNDKDFYIIRPKKGAE
jgi:hypothetical protein